MLDKKIPIGKAGKWLFDFLNDQFYWFFDGVSTSLAWLINNFTELLQAIPAGLFIPLVALGAYGLQRSIKLSIFVVFALGLIVNIGYWQETMATLSLVLFSTMICMGIGIPVGIAAAHRPWLDAILKPILDMMQTIPTFVYLIPTLILFGLGVVPGLISTIVFALAAPIRLTTLGISSVPQGLCEAAVSFGATKRQLLWKVEIPHALPTIMAGVTQCIMLSLSMVVIAALVGADGLGKPVVRALNTVNIAKGIEAGLAIVLVAIVLDRMCKQRSSVKEV